MTYKITFKPIDYRKNFKDKVAVVTGAASGIGRATLEGLCYYGARGVIVDNSEERGSELEKNLKHNGCEALFVQTDVSDRNQVEKMVDKVVKTYGVPNFLVNVAAIEFKNKDNIITMSEEDTKKIFHVNLLGYLNTLKAVVPLMEKNKGGNIVNVSSDQAYASCLPGNIYQVTKAGILSLTNNMVVEYARKGIRTNTLVAGTFKTPIMGEARKDSDGLMRIKSEVPLGRRGTPSEAAHGILFLLSDASSYVLGAELVVDAGLRKTMLNDFGVPNPPVKGDPDIED